MLIGARCDEDWENYTVYARVDDED